MSKVINQEKENLTDIQQNYFGLNKEDLITIFDKYGRNSAFDEDLQEILKFGGTEGILSKLNTNPDRGISLRDTNDINHRIACFGENKFEQEEMPHCCMYVLEGLEDLMVRILIIASIFQVIVGSIPQIQETSTDFVEGISITIAVVLVVSVGSITNFSKEKKFRELNERNNALVKLTIKRDGKVEECQEEEILVGDIIKLSYGMVIPADGYLIEGNEIKCDEAPLTGESDLIEKDPLDKCLMRAEEEIKANKGEPPKGKHIIGSPLLLSGTSVAEGQGWFVALRIGANSENGKIQEQVIAAQKKKGAGGAGSSKIEEEKELDEHVSQTDHKLKEDDKGDDKIDDEDKEDDDNEGKTPLEIKLNELADDVGRFGLISAICTFVALIIRLIYFEIVKANNSTNADSGEYLRSTWFNTTLLGEEPKTFSNNDHISIVVDIIKIIILCIAIIVVAIPEGLPLAVTLSLAFSIGKMMDDNNLVRRMKACETMGGANYICSDKTGTLTKNEMSVSCLYNCNEVIDFNPLTSNKENREDFDRYFTDNYYNVLRLSLILNIEADLNEEEEIVKASKTDIAFVEILHNLKEKITKVRHKYFPGPGEQLKRFPFTSSRKKMTTIIKNKEFPNGNVIFMKGASEIVLNSCKYYLNPETGQEMIITDERESIFAGVIKNFADNALRTICVAYKYISNEEVDNWKNKEEDGTYSIEKTEFCLISIFGIKDKLRDGVQEAVDKCKAAGIVVVMVTGDNIDTAIAIAKECHIITKEDERKGVVSSMVGKDFYEKIGGMVCDSCESDLKYCLCPKTEAAAEILKKSKKKENPDFNDDIPLRNERIKDMDKFKEIYSTIRVIARSRPEDKYTMVYGLRELDLVVAVTGDGTNDAPALSKSDVGFAMGISGTDIAKQAADIIILDDNFATIVQAVKWGRNIYDNIRKFIQFQLTVNVCACLLVFFGSCIGNETPVSAIQMLWLNIIMDSLGSLALATEPPHENLLFRKPYAKTEYIINYKMWKHILFQSFLQLGLMLMLYLYGHVFIEEDDPAKIDVAKRLLKCYGFIPGQQFNENQNIYKIVAGPALYWPSDVYRLPDATPQDCGDFYHKVDFDNAHKYFLAYYGSVHITIIFNSFVFYTLFNQINARVIDDTYNIFYNLHLNWMFIAIIFIEIGLQAIIVQFGAQVLRVALGGLNGVQWGICFGIGACTFIVSLLLKPIRIEKCFEAIAKCKKKGESDIESEQEQELSKKVSIVIEEDHSNLKLDEKNQNHILIHPETININRIGKMNSKDPVKIDETEKDSENVRPRNERQLSHVSSGKAQGLRKSSKKNTEKNTSNEFILKFKKPSKSINENSGKQSSKLRTIKTSY